MTRGAPGRGEASSDDTHQTKRRIIDAALRLFAERGTYQVPLAAIRASAGQRNTSVVQYHFGDREGLIRAIYAHHIPPLHGRSHDLLSALPDDARPVDIARAMFAGYADLLDGTWRDLAFMRFVGELTTRPEWRFEDITELVGTEQADRFNAAIERILAYGPPVSSTLREARVRAAAIMVMHTLAEQASLRAHRRGRDPLPSGVVLANLADMYVGALTAPVSPDAEGPGAVPARAARTEPGRRPPRAPREGVRRRTAR